ncbi:MAG TPA: hypothetical protein PKW56_02140 [Clostridiales bacterium]|nr:hypothetical protein [Clostridiales bacterium]
MRVRNRIFYYFLLFLIIAYASFNLIQKALISPIIRENIVSKAGPAVRADNFDIGEIVIGLSGLILNDVVYEKENVKVHIKILTIDFSLMESLRNLFRPGEKFFKARSVVLNGCDITINPETRPDGRTKWKFEYDDFQKILEFLKEYDYVKSIRINDVNLSYISDFGLKLINGMSGSAEYDENKNIALNLSGKFIVPNGNNISLKGNIDNNLYSAEIDLDLGSNELNSFTSPYGLYNISRGKYAGKMKLEINKYSEKKLYLTGNFSLSGLDMSFNNRVFLRNTEFDLTYINGLVSLNSAKGYINNIGFTGQGRIMNILYPSGDVFFSTSDIPGTLIRELLKNEGFNEIADEIMLSDDNRVELHFTDDITDPRINFKLFSGACKYKNTVAKEVELNGHYKSGRIIIDNSGLLVFNSVIRLNGEINGFSSVSPGYDMSFKSTGLIFSSIPGSPEYLKSLSAIAQGRVSGNFKGFPRLNAKMSAFDFKQNDDDPVFKAELNVKGAIADFSLTAKDGKKDVSGYYDIVNGTYSVSGDDLIGLIGTVTGYEQTEKPPQLFYEMTGNRNFFYVRAGSKDPISLLYGDLEAKFDLGNDKLESFVNWVPGEKNLISRPANFRFALSEDTMSLSDIFFDAKPLVGKLSFNTKNKNIDGNFEAYNFDLGKFFGVKNLTTNTDIVLKLRGNILNPYADLFINENILKYKDAQNDSITISAEAEAHYENKKIRIEKIIVYEGLARVLTASGNISGMKNIELDTYGDIRADYFNPFLTGIKLSGRLKYKAGLTGGFPDIRLKNSDITFSKGSVNGDRIEKIELVTSEFDSTGVLVKKLLVDAGSYLNLNAEGFIPYDERSEIYVTGDFHGDLLGYLDKKTTFISDSYSECEGKFTVEGRYKKPKLKELELYILDGKFTPFGSHKGFSRIRSKLFVDEDLKLDIVKLIMRESSTGAEITVENSVMNEQYGDIIIPGGINLGNLSLKVGEEGIDFNAYRMMLDNDYGNFVLKGKKEKRFRIYKRGENLVLDGKAYLKNARITYPFLEKKVHPKKIKDKKENLSFRNIFGDLELDVEIIPTGGNKYFYNIGTEESSLWKRFVRSFSTLDNELSNVNINISPDSKGLILKGNVFKPRELQYSGTISGRNGTGSYSALSFTVENVSILFDGYKNIRGYTDPYLKASAKTTVKTKIDSTGFSDYETVWLKIVSKDEDGQIIDSGGARISELSIVLVDEFGNSWLDSDTGITGLDTEGTAKQIFAVAVDTKLFSPILSPIENVLGRFLGAQVSIRPNVSGNFIDSELGSLEIPENYAEYFVGSEFFVSKFFTDDLALTWNSKYIGSEEYAEIADREYGYKNSLSFDYRLNNYIFTSLGYQYDSIDSEYGYNLGLTYRYRFMNISEPVDYIKRFLRMR